MLREKFPEFCSSPSPPIEGRERDGWQREAAAGTAVPGDGAGAFPGSSAGIAAVRRVGAGLRGEEGSECSYLWMVVVFLHLSPALR